MIKAFTAYALAFSILASSSGTAMQAYAAQTADQFIEPSNRASTLTGKVSIPENNLSASSNGKTIKIAQKNLRPGIRRAPGARRPLKRSRQSRRGLHRSIEIGVGIAILSIIAVQAARSSGYSRAMRRCERNYRSFDWDTGTNVTYGGNVRLCPYLRPYVR